MMGGEKEIAPSITQSINILNMLKETKVHVFDESHVVTTNTIKQIFSNLTQNIFMVFLALRLEMTIAIY